ncbi:MAG: GNAT family N-acetyltransferase [Anaerolineae bacterium]|nr:GNAT family N-acetyltransferase [Anaerolineae bacterium]
MGDPNLVLPGLVIRTAQEHDLPLLRGESDEPYLQFLFQTAYAAMQRGEQVMWVADLPGNGIVGQVFVQFQSVRPTLANGVDRAYFYSFHVVPEYRGKGVGTRLLQTVESDLQSRGYALVTLTVDKQNERARLLYERNGYHVVGEEVVNVNSEKVNCRWVRIEETAWRMEKRIQPTFGVAVLLPST